MEIMIQKPNGHTRVVSVRKYMLSEEELKEYVAKTYRGYAYRGIYEGLPFGRTDNRGTYRYSGGN